MVGRNGMAHRLDVSRRKIRRRRTHDSFGEVFAVDISIYYAEMRVSTSMDRDLVHDLPTYDSGNAGETNISWYFEAI